MALRYEVKDRENPTWRGQRTSSLGRAERIVDQAAGAPGRWVIVDRETHRMTADGTVVPKGGR